MLLLAALAVACAPSKAAVDYSMSESIIWPGPPEKPRIKYLWSLQKITGGEGPSRFLKFVIGEIDYDISDPRFADILVSPHGVFVSDEEVLYIADSGARRVTVINLKNMDSFNILDAGSLPLLTPIGVVADSSGLIYVTDADLGKVAVFNGKGKFQRFLEGKFKRPTGIAINTSEGVLYVADTWGHVIYKYSLKGGRLGSVGLRGEGPGMLNYPTHIALDRDGNLYVSDTLNFKIQIFSPTGRFLRAFGLIGDTFDTFDKIKGISVDSEGNIYVVDSAQDMVKIFDSEGRLLLFFGEKGRSYGKFYLPSGIYLDRTDRIFVTDSLNNRLQVFQFLGGD